MKKILAEKNKETGASLVEYALLVALVAVVCFVAVQTMGRRASNKFSEIGNEDW